jgi:hypothetical protein
VAWLAAIGCDASVTSVGAWEPVVIQPEAGAGQGGSTSGAGGTGGASGASGDTTVGGGAGEAGESSGPGLYLEAESGVLSGGMMVLEDIKASGGQFIQPPSGAAAEKSAQASYAFDLPVAGDYVIWGRIYSPTVESNRFFFQIDGGNWHLWRITVGNIWYWDDFHEDTQYNDALHFPLAAGPHQLVMANQVPDVKLDRLYITSGDDTPPGNDTPCHPPHSIDLGDGNCSVSCGAQVPAGMRSTCLCDGLPSIKTYDCTTCCFLPQ